MFLHQKIFGFFYRSQLIFKFHNCLFLAIEGLALEALDVVEVFVIILVERVVKIAFVVALDQAAALGLQIP